MPLLPKKWRLPAVVLLVGPLPVAGLAYITTIRDIAMPDDARIVCATFAAIWGLTAGIMRKSLLRAIIGLNLGAALGLFFGAFFTIFDRNFTIFLLCVCGAVMGCGLSMKRSDLLKSSGRGVLAGGLAFLVMGILIWFVVANFSPDLLGWTLMCLLPFGSGLWIFLYLLGRSEIEKPPAQSSSSL